MRRLKPEELLKPFADTNNPDSMYFHVLRFIQHSETINMADSTIYSRKYSIRLFIIWCYERGLTTPNEITKLIIERYQRSLFLQRNSNGEPMGVACQISYLSNIRTFFAWLTKNNHTLYNPAGDIEMPKRGKRLPKNILSPTEASTILNQADITTSYGIRDRAIMEVFYSTGIRRQELANIKTYNLDTSRGTLMVEQGKGDKDRVIPIGAQAINWVKKYNTEVRPELTIGMSDNYLFLGRLGDKLSNVHLSALITKYIKQANIGKTGSCHLFRHTMATIMLENGADIRYIQAMLGHANLGTTQVYTQVNIQKLKEIHNATHPSSKDPSSKEPESKEQQTKNHPESKTYH